MKLLALTVDEINAVLPQTQCQLCSYKGCKPYAEAIVNQGEKINRCPPGGVIGLIKLASLTQQDPAPYLEAMQQTQKPQLRAVIREDECIGCTKCIQACPVDAILGAAKLMHTVITDECTGCELCVAPCPVDCIDIINIGPPLQDEAQLNKNAAHYRARYEAREARLAAKKQREKQQHTAAKQVYRENESASDHQKKQFMLEALARVKARKS